MKKTLTHARLLECLSYDPATGEFRWLRKGHKGRRRQLQIAGYVSVNNTKGPKSIYKFIHIVVDGVHYSGHRLAWFYVHKRWPVGMLDHINRDGCDNRIANLREATKAQNNANSVHAKGASGLRGVRFYKGRYSSQISHENRSVHLGRFRTAEEAHNAWCDAARKLRGEFARTD